MDRLILTEFHHVLDYFMPTLNENVFSFRFYNFFMFRELYLIYIFIHIFYLV